MTRLVALRLGLALFAAAALSGCSSPILPDAGTPPPALPTLPPQAAETPSALAAPTLSPVTGPPTETATAAPLPSATMPPAPTDTPPLPTDTSTAPTDTAQAPTAPPPTETAALPPLPPTGPAPASTLPVPDHVVIVMEENHGYNQVIGAAAAPYLNTLAGQGALFTNAHGVAHPSEPNYLALFSGSTQGVASDACPLHLDGPNLGSALQAGGRSFVGYSESLPAPGATTCASGAYARKHSPWVNFTNLPAGTNQPLSSFPSDFSTLPTVAFVIPNLNNDMHSGSIARGDTWLKGHLGAYVTWALDHNSLLIVQWDEDNGTAGNHIPTIFVGAGVRPGTYDERIDHYSVLRTLEEMYGLPALGHSADAAPIADIWQTGGAP